MRVKFKVVFCADFLEENPEIISDRNLPFQRKENPIHRTVEQGGTLSFLNLFVRNVRLYEQEKSLDWTIYEYHFGFSEKPSALAIIGLLIFLPL